MGDGDGGQVVNAADVSMAVGDQVDEKQLPIRGKCLDPRVCPEGGVNYPVHQSLRLANQARTIQKGISPSEGGGTLSISSFPSGKVDMARPFDRRRRLPFGAGHLPSFRRLTRQTETSFRSGNS